jgi:hypothetical protein
LSEFAVPPHYDQCPHIAAPDSRGWISLEASALRLQ